MENFFPYYFELKLGGHMACALAASLVGGVAIWIAQFFRCREAPFLSSIGFSTLLSTAFWLLPFAFPSNPKISEVAGIILVFGSYPIIKMVFERPWSISALIWSLYLVSQIALFGIVDHYTA